MMKSRVLILSFLLLLCASNACQSKQVEEFKPLTREEAEKLSDRELKKIAEKLLGGQFRAFLNKQTFMTVEEAEKHWGRKTFSALEFRKGDWRKRAEMAVDLVKMGAYLDKPYQEVKKDLGPHDGFFWDDHIPAYIIEDELAGAKESWQLVFLYDGDWIVRNILIHKQ